MQSTKENPLAFFTAYFETGIVNDVIAHQVENNKIEDYINSLSGQHIPEDIRTLPFKEEHLISFEEYVLVKTKQEVNISKEFIEQGFEKRFVQAKEIKSYADFLKTKLNILCQLPKFKEYTFLSIITEDLNAFISGFADTNAIYSNNNSERNAPVSKYYKNKERNAAKKMEKKSKNETKNTVRIGNQDQR